MTSSLVGSEMCIRDRPLTSTIKSTQASALEELAPRKIYFSKFYECFHAVSYTHLTLPTICSV
eukprot:5992903-Prorocentrum_lima.AAC.1